MGKEDKIGTEAFRWARAKVFNCNKTSVGRAIAFGCATCCHLSKVHDITLAQAYWLFVGPAVQLSIEMPHDPDVSIVVDFFRRLAPPSIPAELQAMNWQPLAALSGSLPMGQTHQTVHIQVNVEHITNVML